MHARVASSAKIEHVLLPSCCFLRAAVSAGPDVGTMFGRLVAVAISSGIFAEFPVIALTHLHRRRFKAVDFDVGTLQWHWQLRRYL